MTFPSLELKFVKKDDLKATSTNTINNNINIGNPMIREVADFIPNSPASLHSSSPTNILEFKDALTGILMSYFKSNIVLINNLVELSDKIITKTDDLQLLISFLLDNIPLNEVTIETEELTVKNCCKKISKQLPRYRKIEDILIKDKNSFKVLYNQYYVQLQTQFNISLDYILP
jgi:hypothetical protein